MKNYEAYGIEDFIQDLYFRQWVLEKLPERDRFWNDWITAHPEQHVIIEQAKTLVVAFQYDDLPANTEEVSFEISKILNGTSDKKNSPFYNSIWFKAAASVVIVGGLILLTQDLWRDSSFTTALSDQSGQIDYQEINDTDFNKNVFLNDGSIVTLFPKSNLRIASNFGQTTREVYLTGEAFFDIVKNPRKPFLVYSGKIVTKVLGTSFSIKAYEQDADVSVSVKTGKVTVFKKEKPDQARLSEEIILTPNQQAVFLKEEERLVKTLVKNPGILTASPQTPFQFVYSETPISKVFADLEHIYGVKMIFDEELLKHCSLTATLTNEPLFEKLDLICETIQARYEVADGQILIYGKGCR
ncbi:FecR family protein [Dyadobacter psychrotolerans]|uniref:FecR family protein n=1 Tax=Dyadobacter psychrotolerans TaxID=2541721 RepID=A0A4R5DMC8_9BACT|nr:FecR family protein [Dyadobacter psychrotolerans]TDE15422.1 FecR family protein [Dyadobacter psychrotolerans]